MTVIDIVRDYLTANGYDGLTDNTCGCSLDDLAPCGEWSENAMSCVPGYRVPCDCGEDAEYKCAFHISTQKPGMDGVDGVDR